MGSSKTDVSLFTPTENKNGQNTQVLILFILKIFGQFNWCCSSRILPLTSLHAAASRSLLQRLKIKNDNLPLLTISTIKPAHQICLSTLRQKLIFLCKVWYIYPILRILTYNRFSSPNLILPIYDFIFSVKRFLVYFLFILNFKYLVRALLDLSLGGRGSTVCKAKARVTWKVIHLQVHL